MNTLRGRKKLQTKNKKRGGNVSIPLPPQRSSAKSLNKRIIRIIQLTLGCVELFFNRGRNDTEPRACQAT